MVRCSSILVLVTLIITSSDAGAHCQIPCGIYDDHARVQMMREDITTIAKAVKQIQALARKRDAQSANQLARWVAAKDLHAERIIRSISDYYMAQKIKPVAAKKDRKANARYLQMLARHHAVMVAAMRCKQSARQGEVQALRRAVNAIAEYWPPAGR